MSQYNINNVFLTATEGIKLASVKFRWSSGRQTYCYSPVQHNLEVGDMVVVPMKDYIRKLASPGQYEAEGIKELEDHGDLPLEVSHIAKVVAIKEVEDMPAGYEKSSSNDILFIISKISKDSYRSYARNERQLAQSIRTVRRKEVSDRRQKILEAMGVDSTTSRFQIGHDTSKQMAPLYTPDLGTLGLPSAIQDLLESHGIMTVNMLCNHTPKQLLLKPGIGKKYLASIVKLLSSADKKLTDET